MDSGKREGVQMKREHSRNISLLCALAALALLCAMCSGCGMTAQQHMYLACGADMGSTYYALEIDGGYSEGSPIVEDNDWAQIIAGNAALCGLGEGAALADPEHKDLYYWLIAGVKYAFAAWNVGLMASD